MIKVKIQAGLGNQMFQYALARAIKERIGKEIVLDLSFYSLGGVAKGDTPRGYGMNKFNIDTDIKLDYSSTPKNKSIFEKIKRRFLNESAFVFYKKYLNPIDNSYLIGYWQSEKYFKDIENIIKKEFTLIDKIENRDKDNLSKIILNRINNSKNSISIGIRRGDYVSDKKMRAHHGLISIEYFIQSIYTIMDRLKVKENELNIFLSSDNITWCKENFKELELKGFNIFYIPENIEPSDHIYIISKCEHNIISNSSFFWWGAWLNENREKIVVAPKHWMRAKIDTKDICPTSWIRLENRFY